MSPTDPLESDEIENSSELEVGRQARDLARGQGSGIKVTAEELAALMRRLAEAPIRELDHLINQLQTLRTQLKNRSNRIQDEVAEYSELSQQTSQLTSIIVDSVRKIPGCTSR
jgi:flagellin-like hook-associated protein FlgL